MLTTFPWARVHVLWDIHQRRLHGHGFKPIENLYWLAGDYTGNSGFQCSSRPFSRWAFKHKSYPGLTYLTRTVSQKQNRRSQEARLVHLEFPRAIGFEGLGLRFCFGWWCHLGAKLCGLNGYFHHGVICAKISGHITLDRMKRESKLILVLPPVCFLTVDTM